ncbi:hypothetical protein BDGGKGIB_04073 [Nodularia sphaerocarpa UHCC 0038]|nr:hypothetical protein BDGGKGIB_04073 [Nodularia sphaerocarpa UHCC 0038]
MEARFLVYFTTLQTSFEMIQHISSELGIQGRAGCPPHKIYIKYPISET